MEQYPKHSETSKVLDGIRQHLRQDATMLEVLDKYGVDPQELDLIPICFAALEVSARTEHGCIYLNWDLLEKPDEIPGYLIHEITHFCQQTTGDGPTQGSNDSNYLDNPYEVEGFQYQTEYIADNKSPEEAEGYIDQVLEHHDVKGKERKKRKEQLLQLASERQLSFKGQLPTKTKEELASEFELALERGPQENHMRPAARELPQQRQQYLLERLRNVLDAIDAAQETALDNPIRERRDIKKKLRQLLLERYDSE